MTVQEIRKEIKNLKDREVKEINGYIVRRSGSDYGVRNENDYMDHPYTIYPTQKSLIETIA